jgi:AraC-like DNA-binding protein
MFNLVKQKTGACLQNVNGNQDIINTVKMIVKQFADNTTLNRLTNIISNNDSKKIVWPNLMVNTTVNDFKKNLSETSLTLISNINGQADCKIDTRSFKVCSSVFLVANPFQKLDYSIPVTEKIETTNIHFNYSFVQNLFNYFTASDISLLDNSKKENTSFPLFFNELHYKNKTISTLIKQLSVSKDEYQFEEILSDIGVHLFLIQSESRKKIKSIKSRNKTTQKELYRRISMAKDIIYSNHGQPISIEEISKNVCVSKYHFTRLFKDIYGISPYQFLKTVRLEKAKELLLKDYTLAEIAHQVGFVESNSFINAFKSYTKIYPTGFRQLISKIE